MFSSNEKISGRQAFRLLVFDLLGLGTLLIPTAVAGFCGRDGIFCIIAGTVAGILFLKLMVYAVGDMQGSFAEYTVNMCGTFFGKIIQAGYFLYLVLLAGYTAYLFSVTVLNNLLRGESFYLVLVLILGLVWYGLLSGIEGRARVYELLFWIILIPLFIMLASALDEVKTDYWNPVFFTERSDFFAGSYYVFICSSLIFLVLFLGGYLRKRESLMKAGRLALIFTGCLEAGLYLILLGVFGGAALSDMQTPAITLMSTIKITGGFLKRADAFMFGIWFFTLYALLNSAVFYAEMLLNGLYHAKKRQTLWKKWERAAVFAVVFGIAVFFYSSKENTVLYEKFVWYIGTPFLVLIPVVFAVIRYKKQWKHKNYPILRVYLMIGVLFVLTGLSGCATAELEERNFPIEMAVCDMEQFDREWLNADESGNRVVDYSHMKVILLDQTFLEDAENMDAFLEILEKKSDVPRNTYLVVAEDAQAILNLQENMEESVGTYLEDYFENVSEIKKTAYPTIGMLYQEQENKMETLFIPYVGEAEKKTAVRGYYVWKRGEAAGLINNQTAMLSFFIQNQMKEYTLTLADGVDVRLFDPHNQIVFSQTEDKRVIAEINCSGEILYEKPGWRKKIQAEYGQGLKSGDIKEELEKQITEYFQIIAQKAEIDCMNSYKKLGGQRRDWYLFYQKQPKQYEKDMEIIYKVKVDWVNLGE